MVTQRGLPFLAAICLFKGLNADEAKDFANAGASI